MERLAVGDWVAITNALGGRHTGAYKVTGIEIRAEGEMEKTGNLIHAYGGDPNPSGRRGQRTVYEAQCKKIKPPRKETDEH